MLTLSGCSVAGPPPDAEFLIASRDATYWVSSGREGVNLRSSPLVLARSAGRYYEVYTAEVDHSFEGGLFVGERVFRRSLPGRDSAMIFEDSTVTAFARAYGSRYPQARAVPADEFEGDDEIGVSVTGETDLLGVFGPYVVLEHRSAVENGVSQFADTIRRVVDIRSGRPVRMSAVIRDSLAREAIAGRGGPGGRWRRRGYEVAARFDSTRHATLLVLRGRPGEEWPLGYVRSSLPRIFWLDGPEVDVGLRNALRAAFDRALRHSTRWILA